MTTPRIPGQTLARIDRRTLLRASVPAGTATRLRWDLTDDTGRRVPSGVYFLRLVAPGLSASAKVVLLP